jgi:signal transduction histidine kinase
MKSSWTQPSLSRDFALLSAAIFFVLLIISGWVTFSTYNRHTDTVAFDLEKESKRIENVLANQFEDANFILASLGKQIILDPNRDLQRLAQILKSFDKKDYVYSILSWINPQDHLVVSSNKGVLDKPIDISDRDYVKMALVEHWKMVIGKPVEGRISGHWVIPVAMGITDYTGKFIGTVAISIEVNILTQQLASIVYRDGINFAIVSKDLVPITQGSADKDFITNNFPANKLLNVNLSKNPVGLVSKGSMFWDRGNYSFYRTSSEIPYTILLTYDPQFSDETVHGSLWARLLQITGMAVFFVLFLWITRVRIIRPIMKITDTLAAVAKGHACGELPKSGPIEIEALATQILKVSEYIGENKRIEKELRHKMSLYIKNKEQSEMERRSLSEFLTYTGHEMRGPINNIIGGAQVLKDQLHGPIDNRKYRQYATDIHVSSNELFTHIQDLLAFAQSETGAFKLIEKPINISTAIETSLRIIADKIQTKRLSVKVNLQEPTPHLMADEFRLQQILINILLLASDHAPNESALNIAVEFIQESKEKGYYSFVISSNGKARHLQSGLLDLADELFAIQSQNLQHATPIFADDHHHLGLELAKALILAHGGCLDIAHAPDNSISIALFFPGNRIRLSDVKEN